VPGDRSGRSGCLGLKGVCRAPDTIAARFATFDAPTCTFDRGSHEALNVFQFGSADDLRMTLGNTTGWTVALIDHVAIRRLRTGRHRPFFGTDGGHGANPFFEALPYHLVRVLIGPLLGDAIGELARVDAARGRREGIEDPIAEGIVALRKLVLSLQGQRINEAGASNFPPLLFVADETISFENGQMRADRHGYDADLPRELIETSLAVPFEEFQDDLARSLHP
jgi:hypothetical protein